MSPAASIPGARGREPDARGRESGPRRVGIFGGSFDPVHAGHLHVARAAQAARGLEQVVFVPAARPPHKPERILASGADRVAMLELALAGEPASSRWSVADLELERSGPSYTIDTVRELPGRLGLAPQAELYLLLGSDNLRDLPRWREADELLSRVHPIVLARSPLEPILRELQRELAPELVAKLRAGLLDLSPVEVSSSDVRGQLARGEDPGRALPAGVLEYIRRQGIYGCR
jgi:nicotinate-nucleotide adenylyltransferase